MQNNKFESTTTYTYAFKQGDSYLSRDRILGYYGWSCEFFDFPEKELNRIKRYLKRNIAKNYSTDPNDPVMILKIKITTDIEESAL